MVIRLDMPELEKWEEKPELRRITRKTPQRNKFCCKV